MFGLGGRFMPHATLADAEAARAGAEGRKGRGNGHQARAPPPGPPAMPHPAYMNSMPYSIPGANQPPGPQTGHGRLRDAPGPGQPPMGSTQPATQSFTQGGTASQGTDLFGSGYSFAELGTQESFNLPDNFTQTSLSSQGFYDSHQHLFDGQLSQPSTQPGPDDSGLAGLDFHGLYDENGMATQEFSMTSQVLPVPF
eukprot:scaffold243264_cov45-Prasinocladus_malaysianus.AAC.1